MGSFDFAWRELPLSGRSVRYVSLRALEAEGICRLARLPWSVRILLEAVVRMQGRPGFAEEHVTALGSWRPDAPPRELPFLPARILLQDFTGVPCLVDLAMMRSELERRGRDPRAVEPGLPVDLVIDHSVQVDAHGSPDALACNMARELERNAERFSFLRWGQQAFRNLRVFPPGLGICHQVNMEYLASLVCVRPGADGGEVAFPDSVLGTDSHTTMINSLGVLGWGVGGIEAEAAMLGQPIPLLTPKVVGVRLVGSLPPEASATDLALTVTRVLRERGVVGQFVEFFGPALEALGVPERAPLANMAPEYGATMGFFAPDARTLEYLRETGRSNNHVALVEAYLREQQLFRTAQSPVPEYAEVVELNLSSVGRTVAGPLRPHDSVPLSDVGSAFDAALTRPREERGYGVAPEQVSARVPAGECGFLEQGSVVLASIASCTNTSTPELMLAAGLLAKKAVARGLRVPPHVKTSFAPGSRAVVAYLARAGLLEPLEQLGFHVAAYGCATCIGHSGPVPSAVAEAVRASGLIVAAVLCGNRNFEGRIHPLTRAQFLCSPALVVAYALRGTVRGNLEEEPLGSDPRGRPVYLRDLWPTPQEIQELRPLAADPEIYRRAYADTASFNEAWNRLPASGGVCYAWNPASTYIREPPFLANLPEEPQPPERIREAACLVWLGDHVTTDHISPAGAIAPDSPAARYLSSQGVAPQDFNTYGARRGNHEVMVRGTFSHPRLRNRLIRQEGGLTVYHPTGLQVSVYDAARLYQVHNAPLILLAGKMYGAGSSRDWAAKGTRLLSVQAVLAESFERIHRSNLVGMGVLPLEFLPGQNAESLGLTGTEAFTIEGLNALTPGALLRVRATPPGGPAVEFNVRARLDSPLEVEYFRHGGLLPYVFRQILRAAPRAGANSTRD